MPGFDRPSWTASLAKQLRNHELANTGLDGDLPASEITAESLLPAQLAAKAAELAQREAAVSVAESRLRFSTLIRTLQFASKPFSLGGRDGVTPSPDFDCVLTNNGPHGSVMDLPRQILWIPVPLYAIPVTGKSHPIYGAKHILGETRVQDSLCFPLLASPKPRSDYPSQPTLLPVAINAYAQVTLSQYSPTETLSRLDRRDSRHTIELNSPTSDTDTERDNLDPEAASPAFSSSPLTFTERSRFNISSPHPDPTSVAAHNPTSSPTAPFDPSGNAARP